MSEPFAKAVGELFRRLRLGPPSIGDRPSVDLVVDAITVVLEESDDGNAILLTARAGRLSADPFLAQGQVRKILGIAAGILKANGSILCLDATAPDPKPVLARHRVPYGARPDDLVDAIQDVLQAVEIASPDLATRADRPTAVTPRDEPLFGESLIFRP